MTISRNLSQLAEGVGTSGVLSTTNGGTGQTTASAAFNALSPITTAGDLILGTGANAAGRLALGADGTVLSVVSGALAYAAPSSGALTLISTQTASSSATLSWIGLSGYKDYLLILTNLVVSVADQALIQFGEGVTPTWNTSGYAWNIIYNTGSSPVGASVTADSGIRVNSGGLNTPANPPFFGAYYLGGLNSTTSYKLVSGQAATSYSPPTLCSLAGAFSGDTNAITAVRLIMATGGETFVSGTASLYGISS